MPAKLTPVLETLHEAMAGPARRQENEPPFDPSMSPLYGKVIFIVGVPRSGTTWLHSMIAAHPDVATAGEAHIFCEGVSPMLVNHDNPDPHMFLSTWVSRAELLGLLRRLTDGIFETMRASNRPKATRILDKTPNHEAYAAHLRELYPDASYVHIIRDARDSVSSQRDLWGSWHEASRVWTSAARNWQMGIEDNRRHLAGGRYHELRYEDLVRDPIAGLTAVYDAVGLAHDPEFVEAVVAFCRAPINVRPSDERVGVRKWADMDPLGERDIVVEAGVLMVELGYLTDDERRTIAARRSWKDVPRTANEQSRHVAAGAARRIRSKVKGFRDHAPAPATVRATGDKLGAAVTTGDVDAAAAMLTRDARLEEPTNGATTTGAGRGGASGARAVAERLVEVGGGGRVASTRADAEAVSIHLVTESGAHLHVRAFRPKDGDGTTVQRLVIQG
jgi:hypothetical protein